MDDVSRQRRRPVLRLAMTMAMLYALVMFSILATISAAAANAGPQQPLIAAVTADWIRIPLATADRAHNRRRLQQLAGDRDRDLSSEALRNLHIALQQQRIRRRLGETAPSPVRNDSNVNASANATVVNRSMVYSEVSLGVGFGTHYAELYLGVPAQRASVIVDTGSHLTALPCSSCRGCGDHTDPFFDIAKSTTAKFATCQDVTPCNTCSDDKCYISQSYTEGSMWQAVVVDELVWVGGFAGADVDAIVRHFGVRFPLGCQTKETGLFLTQKENGIMGLGRHRATVLSHMLRAKRVLHDVFALCFGARGGGLVLGGVDPTHHTTAIAYTPLVVDTSGWYPVRVKDIRVGGASLGVGAAVLNSGKGVIVDSGTTDTFFVAAAARAFERAFQAAANGVAYSERQMRLSAADVAKLPMITIVLEGVAVDSNSSNSSDTRDVELVVPPTKYLTLADDGSYYYGNFHFTERSGGVIGASTMVGYDVVFDTENKRVGFAEANCDAMSANSVGANATATGTDAGTDAAVADATNRSDNPLDALDYRSFVVQILAVSAVGIVLVAVAWRRMRQRAWYAIPGDSTLGTPKEDDFSTDDDDLHAQQQPPDSTTSTTAVRSSPRRQQVVSPKFTIGSDDEDEFVAARTGDDGRSPVVDDDDAKDASARRSMTMRKDDDSGSELVSAV